MTKEWNAEIAEEMRGRRGTKGRALRAQNQPAPFRVFRVRLL
jgi:hypothetical protein